MKKFGYVVSLFVLGCASLSATGMGFCKNCDCEKERVVENRACPCKNCPCGQGQEEGKN